MREIWNLKKIFIISIIILLLIIYGLNKHKNIKEENLKLKEKNIDLIAKNKKLKKKSKVKCDCGWYEDFYYENAEDCGVYE